MFDYSYFKKVLPDLGFFFEKSLNEDKAKTPVDEYLHERTGLYFVLIPSGNFLMGDDGENADSDELPKHQVVISQPFLLARTPCTQKAWLKGVEGSNLSSNIEQLAQKARFPTFGNRSNQPVYYVTWLDCYNWCQLNGLELPSEVQWEYACRAETTTQFYFGDIDLNDLDELNKWMCYSENNSGEASEVGCYPPNLWGLYDMHGNVWEWCRDFYDSSFYSHSDIVDPCNKKSGDKRVHRGGAWDVPAFCCRSSARYRDSENYCLGNIGFRPSLTLKLD
jgi:formylglycine-generating enzyme required for sulfatase activity